MLPSDQDRKQRRKATPRQGAHSFFSYHLTCSLILILLLLSESNSQSAVLPIPKQIYAISQASVAIVDYEFRPIRLNITTDTIVIWTYSASGTDIHTVTAKNRTQSGSPIFASTGPPLRPGQSYNFTFNSPGNYAYFCGVHPTLMNAWVNVTGPPIVPPNPSRTPSTNLLEFVIGIAIAVAAIGILWVRNRRDGARASAQ